jgi:perosamine synthetase
MSVIAFSRPFLGIEEEVAAAAAIRSGWVVGGPRLVEFENRFAALCEVEHAIAVSSWTTGSFLVLKVMGVGPGDEVIVPSLTFIASVNVIAHCGAQPVFADVDPLTYNINPDDVARKVNSRTKAILPVDQIGLPCEIDRILAIAQKRGLMVIQDCACSVGSRFRGRIVGSFAPVSVFSLHARKVVTTGEGGMIVTNDANLARRLRLLRHQGMSLTDFERTLSDPTRFETYPEIGYNFRMTDIQAAIGLCQLDRLDNLIDRRTQIARRYIAELSTSELLDPPYVPDYATPNWQSFQVRVKSGNSLDRNGLMKALHAQGIATRRGVMASHLEPPYKAQGVYLPATEAAAAQCLQLPIHAAMDSTQVDTVLAALDRVCGRV